MKRNICLGGLAVAVLMALATATQAGMYDLTYSTEVTINGGLFTNTDAHSTGTGVMQPFLRLHQRGNATMEQGYNSNWRPNQLDQDNAWNAALPLSLVPIMDIDGTLYREFLLDINQQGSGNNIYLSLDYLKIYQTGDPSIHGYDTGWPDPIYTLGTGGGDDVPPASTENWIKMAYDLPGSGWGDLYAYIPNSLFTDSPYVVLYSMLGNHAPNIANDGFEEWGVRGTTPIVPLPGAVLLGVLGMGAAGWRLRRFA
jgi:hypothetical protein